MNGKIDVDFFPYLGKSVWGEKLVEITLDTNTNDRLSNHNMFDEWFKKNYPNYKCCVERMVFYEDGKGHLGKLFLSI